MGSVAYMALYVIAVLLLPVLFQKYVVEPSELARETPYLKESTPSAPRDPLIAQYFERWVDAMVYQLFFPEELQAARLDFFTLLSEANLADVDKGDRLDRSAKAF